MSKIYTFPNKASDNTDWKEKLGACACYFFLAWLCQVPGQFPMMGFLFYSLGYWVIIQPRRLNFTLFLRLHVLQALFAFVLLSGAFQLILLVGNFSSALLGLFNLPASTIGLQYLYGQSFILFSSYSCLALAIVGCVFTVRGQSKKLPIAGEWAASLA